MTSPDLAISIRGLSKSYRIGHDGRVQTTLGESLGTWLKGGFRSKRFETFWALRDLSFDVRLGEVLGIIGRNGAGKSTLLKILSRITCPTTGEVELYGRVGSLLEVGTGFHPELTGRENIFLNGTLLGMANAEIRKQLDAIVDFSGVEQFLDTPVKRYSSGMYVRLAFSVAAHLRTEILIVDEVLAVGDLEFQKRCTGKMTEVSESGRTVLFVSHSLATVEKLCTRAILLESGTLQAVGNVCEVIGKYLCQANSGAGSTYVAAKREELPVSLLHAEVLDSAGRPAPFIRFGEPFSIGLLWHHSKPVPAVSYSVRVFSQGGQFVFAANTINDEQLGIENAGNHGIVCAFSTNILPPGHYSVTIGAWVRPHSQLQVIEECLKVVVESTPFDDAHRFEIIGSPVAAVRSTWTRCTFNRSIESSGAH